MLKLLNLLLIAVRYIMCSRGLYFVEAVDCCRLLCAIESSCFVGAVKSVVKAVDCCRLLCALESSSFVESC